MRPLCQAERAPLEAPPERLATLARWYLAEKNEVSDLLIGFKKFFFLNLGCYIKVPILNVGSIKT